MSPLSYSLLVVTHSFITPFGSKSSVRDSWRSYITGVVTNILQVRRLRAGGDYEVMVGRHNGMLQLTNNVYNSFRCTLMTSIEDDVKV